MNSDVDWTPASSLPLGRNSHMTSQASKTREEWNTKMQRVMKKSQRAEIYEDEFMDEDDGDSIEVRNDFRAGNQINFCCIMSIAYGF